MRNSIESVPFHVEKFAAPDGAIETVSGAVPGNTEVGSPHIVFCRAGGNVRLMMLNANQRKSGLFGPVGGGVVGMQITGHDLGFKTVEATQVIDGFFEGGPGFEGFEIADVLAEKNVLAHANSDGILGMAAYGEHRRQALGDANAQRGVTAGTPQDSGASAS